MKDNNQNDYDMPSAPADKYMMDMCRNLPLFPAEFEEIIKEEPPIGNDKNEPTLNTVNVLGEDKDVKEFYELTTCQQNYSEQVEHPQLPSDGIFYADQEQMEWADYSMEEIGDQKQQYYEYTMDQPPVEIDRMEYQAAQNLASSPSGPLLSAYDTSYPPSPTSTICSFNGEQINNNENYKRGSRTRKMSVRVGGKSGKVEKPYRQRRTKAEMEEMSAREKIELKQEQNRINAKKCVARKNEGKQKLSEELPELEDKLKQLQNNNQMQKDGLSSGYEECFVPPYDNNSPYGIPSEFKLLLNREKVDSVQKIIRKDDGRLEQLKDDMDEMKAKYDEVLKQNQKNVKQNTYASRKSRAKSSWDLAVAKYENSNFRRDIAIEQMYWNKLTAFARVLNPYFREQRRPLCAEEVVHVEFDQYEPS